MLTTLAHDASDSQALEREISLPPTQAEFDYSALPTGIRDEAKIAADEIRGLMNRTVFEVGAALTRVKDRLPRGQFGKWLLAEFGLTERTAQNYMNAAALVAKCETVSVLQPRTVYLLASPSTPEAVKREVIERFDAGERIPDRTIKAMVGQAKVRQQEEQRRADEAAGEAQLSARTRRSRAQRRAEEERREQEWKREQAEKKEATNRAADLLIANLPPEAVAPLQKLLRECTLYEIGSALLDRLKSGDLQPVKEVASDPSPPESKPTAAVEPVKNDRPATDDTAENAVAGDPLTALQTQYADLSDRPGARGWIMRRLCQGEVPAKGDESEVAEFIRRFIAAPVEIQKQFRAHMVKRPEGAGGH